MKRIFKRIIDWFRLKKLQRLISNYNKAYDLERSKYGDSFSIEKFSESHIIEASQIKVQQFIARLKPLGLLIDINDLKEDEDA